MQMTRPAAWTASVVLAVAALAGCAGRPDDGAAATSGPKAPATAAAGELAAAAEVMGRAGNSRIRFRVAAKGMSTTGTGFAQWSGRPALQYDNGKQGIVRIVGGALYFAFTPDLTGKAEEWSVMRLDDNGPAPVHLSTLATERVADPAAELRRAAARGNLTDRGTEDVAGTPVKRFHSSVPLVRRSGSAGHGLWDGLADFMPPLGATCTADFWINERHELVRLTLSLVSGPDRQDIEAEYSEPGSAPEITVPAPTVPML
ncbi:hypothetical protein [Kitasatospora purpeofusca]|uniref:hypothetical protein n=1 Tax=Kitasatospora purpeofusca TaxID=67352 RepID=UPI00225822F0|nr:hypothetical protein [Kitasatospora purpeofusca]MCX4752860.1 hypothetical protein [Kitasatospora purpeofusca]WSR32408.1 hypothetical protein OG715_16300 [Kitasatospora purpeofusca]